MYNFTSISNPLNINIFKFSEQITIDEFNSYKDNLNFLLNQQNPFYAVFDLLEIKSFNIGFFLKQISYMYSKQDLVKKYLKGSVILVDDSYKTLINVTLAIKKPINPNIVTSNLEDGIQFLILL